jgi:hypothetical protein
MATKLSEPFGDPSTSLRMTTLFKGELQAGKTPFILRGVEWRTSRHPVYGLPFEGKKNLVFK